MPKHHRYLLGLITLASLVTVVFQCFWLYGNYQHEKENMIAHAERILFEGIQEERDAQFERVAPEEYRQLKAHLPRINRQFKHRNEKRHSNAFFATPSRIPPPGAKHRLQIKMAMPALRADSLDEQGILHRNLFHLNFRNLQEHLKKKMTAIGLENAYHLDTLKISSATKSVETIRNDSKFPIQTAAMILNPDKGTFVILNMKIPPFWLFKKLAWSLISSFTLIALTIGCLVYMLYTIFRQKKLADIKNDFVNNMTHELKTPLATVLAATESLQQFDFGYDQQKRANEYLHMTYRAASHLTNLLDQLLHLAVDEKKGLHLQIERIDVSTLLKQLIETHQLTGANDMQICIEEKENIPYYIYADPIHISNAVNNLLDNAIKYTINTVAIQVISKIEGNKWILSIADNGIGISLTDLQHIFQPFYRVSTGNIHRIKGFGLGLYYVKQVINQHGGQIQVNSSLGRGTTFTISLPINI